MPGKAERWTADIIKPVGHAEWLCRTGSLLIAAMRVTGGLPSRSVGVLRMEIPTLRDRARCFSSNTVAAPGTVRPTGVIKFTG